MDERDPLTERFEEQRPRLRAVAYRMLLADPERVGRLDLTSVTARS